MVPGNRTARRVVGIDGGSAHASDADTAIKRGRNGMTLQPDIVELVDMVRADLERVFGAELVGLYLRGSLALGDFIPATSDVDLLAVTEHPLTAAQFAFLADMHARIAASPNSYGTRMEIAYIDRAALRRFAPGRRHATLGQGETLGWAEHSTNWLLERWTVREHGVTLLGPDPRALIDPVDADDIRAAVRARLRDWADWADQVDDPDWFLPRSHKAYVVETMCRALATLATGEIWSKPRAVAWALAHLPEPWRTTVERSQQWRTDPTFDLDAVEEARRFVYWAAGQGASAT